MKTQNKTFLYILILTGLIAIIISQLTAEPTNSIQEDQVQFKALTQDSTLPQSEDKTVRPWSWFLIGSWGTVVIFFVISLIRR